MCSIPRYYHNVHKFSGVNATLSVVVLIHIYIYGTVFLEQRYYYFMWLCSFTGLMWGPYYIGCFLFFRHSWSALWRSSSDCGANAVVKDQKWVFSCGLAFAFHYVECVNVPDPSTSVSSFGVPSVVDVSIMVWVLGYRHLNQAQTWKADTDNNRMWMHHVLHTVVAIEPDESSNMSFFIALE